MALCVVMKTCLNVSVESQFSFFFNDIHFTVCNNGKSNEKPHGVKMKSLSSRYEWQNL